MLGVDLVSAATAAGNDVHALSRAELDITDAGAVQAAVRDGAPEIVFNCAAWTDVDGAETSEQEALAVNGAGAANLARAAAAAGAWVVHISTDYVFDGRGRAPYVESDPTGPLSAYGRSKLAGELQVAAQAPGGHTIVRSSWLFGAGGKCFPQTILRLSSVRDHISVVNDQVGCPTFTGHLAHALLTLATGAPPPLGIVHLAAGGACSWYELARELISTAGVECEVTPGRTADLGRPAPRPAYSVLGTERGNEAPRLPDWREGLADYLAVTAGARAR